MFEGSQIVGRRLDPKCTVSNECSGVLLLLLCLLKTFPTMSTRASNVAILVHDADSIQKPMYHPIKDRIANIFARCCSIQISRQSIHFGCGDIVSARILKRILGHCSEEQPW